MTEKRYSRANKALLSDARTDLALKIGGLLEDNPDRISGLAALRLVIDVLDKRCMLVDAAAFIYDYARSQGYYLPPFAIAGCGEIREFLSDAGVADIPSWYASIGFDQERYKHIENYQLLVAMNQSYQRIAIALPRLWWEKALSDTSQDALALELSKYLIAFTCRKSCSACARLF